MPIEEGEGEGRGEGEEEEEGEEEKEEDDEEEEDAVADLGGDPRVPWNPPFTPGYLQLL